MAGQTVGTITHLGFEVLDRPAYSPDIATSDRHLFGPICYGKGSAGTGA
jgi:hypothetical protein